MNESQRRRISAPEKGLIMGRVWSPLISLQTGLRGKQTRPKSLHSSFHKIQDVIFICVCLEESLVIYEAISDETNKLNPSIVRRRRLKKSSGPEKVISNTLSAPRVWVMLGGSRG